MRWIVVSVLFVSMLFAASLACAQEAEEHGMGYGIGRSFANIGLGWLEIPRGILYENVKLPVLGLGLGAVKGAGLTVWRTLLGVSDLLTLGLVGDKLYTDEIPEFVWQADWMPESR